MRFLGEEWIEAVRAALNADPDFQAAAAGQSARIQQVVTRAEEDPMGYWLTISDGAADMGLGELPDAEVTITQDYATAVALAKSELSPVSAFMSGRVQVSNLMKVMGLQTALSQLPSILGKLDVEY